MKTKSQVMILGFLLTVVAGYVFVQVLTRRCNLKSRDRCHQQKLNIELRHPQVTCW